MHDIALFNSASLRCATQERPKERPFFFFLHLEEDLRYTWLALTCFFEGRKGHQPFSLPWFLFGHSPCPGVRVQLFTEGKDKDTGANQVFDLPRSLARGTVQPAVNGVTSGLFLLSFEQLEKLAWNFTANVFIWKSVH